MMTVFFIQIHVITRCVKKGWHYTYIYEKYFYFSYNSIKMWMQDGDSKKALGWTKHLACASEAGQFSTTALDMSSVVQWWSGNS